ncbi:MAG: DUF427 domain-containing protein [Candidatus Dormibacteraeota bacterium]|nr:DUF427 domain-containing protein [Candidatus Dormibacteraeota bacterium]
MLRTVPAESVWAYPRPPRVEPSSRRVEVRHGGLLIASSARSLRVLETSHPPVYYLPPDDVRTDLLRPGSGSSYCEFKGQAGYADLVLPEGRVNNAAWFYARPLSGYEALRDYLAFYPGRVDEVRLDGERVLPQAGGFYGGWITSELIGPFKGEPGTSGW